MPEFTNGVYPFLQPSYTDPGYMSLIHTKDDHNQAYTELNSTQINSGTTERHWEPDYLEPVATIKYQNALEMKTYANT